MVQQINRFSVHQTAKVLAILYALLGFLMVPLIWLSTLADPDGALPLWALLVFPLAYGLLGYIFTAMGCAIYNFVADRIGGIEFSLSTVPDR